MLLFAVYSKLGGLITSDIERLLQAFFCSTERGQELACLEPALIEARDGLGETALHYLSVENQIEAVQALVAMGAEVNTVSYVGGTPLSEAASLGYVELVRYLLSSGAQLYVKGQEEPTLHEAVRSGNYEVVKLILEAGANVNEVASLRETALHIAAEEDENVSIVQLLATAGADLSAQRIFDETPLAVARRSGAQNIVKVLTQLGAQ